MMNVLPISLVQGVSSSIHDERRISSRLAASLLRKRTKAVLPSHNLTIARYRPHIVPRHDQKGKWSGHDM